VQKQSSNEMMNDDSNVKIFNLCVARTIITTGKKTVHRIERFVFKQIFSSIFYAIAMLFGS
jgi:hypothetical protein